MLQPKRVRYRRPQDGRGNKGNAHRGTQLAFGSFGIKTLEAKWIDSRQIEAARVAVNRYMQLEKAKFYDLIGEDNICSHINLALERAKEIIK